MALVATQGADAADAPLGAGRCSFPGVLDHSCRYAILGQPCNPCRWHAVGKCKKKKEEACKFCHIRPPPGLAPPVPPPTALKARKELAPEEKEEVRAPEAEEPLAGRRQPGREEPDELVVRRDASITTQGKLEVEQSEELTSAREQAALEDYVKFLDKIVGEAPAARLLLHGLRSSLGEGRERNQEHQGLHRTKRLIEEMDEFYSCGPHHRRGPRSGGQGQGQAQIRGGTASQVWRFGSGGQLHDDLRVKVQEASSLQEIAGWLAVARLVEILMGSLKAKARGVERIHFEEDDELAALQRQLLDATQAARSFEDCRQSLRRRYGDVLLNSRAVRAA